MVKFTFTFILFIVLNIEDCYSQKQLCITIDDPNTYSTPLLTWEERNTSILKSLDKHSIKAALFVCGMRVNDENGSKLLKSWDDNNHLLCNHSYSHWYFPSSKISLSDFINDVKKSDSIIKQYKNYTKLFRFPYLKEGNTVEKKDGMRNFLHGLGYKNGYVTIDASDWYIDSELSKTLTQNKEATIVGYKQFYIHHILDRIHYYDSLSTLLYQRDIPHALLLHHNLLNALFLDDLLQEIKNKGWELMNASDAFKDSIYSLQPNILPAGESLIWQSAKADSLLSKNLRYPAEDSQYEHEPLKEFLLRFGSHKK